uniref:Gag-pol polyprotein n=1 Tax=Panagrellus redivivus TaxID=6233 RepID=A0A7E4VEP2_PANRE
MAPQLVAKYGRRPLKQTNAHHPAQSQNPRRSAANNPCPDSRQRNRRGVDTSVVRHPQREDRPAFHKRRSNGRQLCHPSNPTLYPSHTDRRSTKNTKVTETNTKKYDAKTSTNITQPKNPTMAKKAKEDFIGKFNLAKVVTAVVSPNAEPSKEPLQFGTLLSTDV